MADVFDALSTKPCYKEAFPVGKCFSIVGEVRGTHFDPSVLDALFSKRSEIVEVQMRFANDA